MITEKPDAEFNNTVLEKFGRRPTSMNDIKGLLTLIKKIPGNVLEIGAWYGKTTYELATRFPEKIFYTVDWLENKLTEIEQRARADKDDIGRYSKYLDNVKLHYLNSADFEYSGKNISLVFIDGDHSYDGVKKDTEKALENLKPGDIICWHDSLITCFGVPHYLEKEIDPVYKRKIFLKSQISWIEL